MQSPDAEASRLPLVDPSVCDIDQLASEPLDQLLSVARSTGAAPTGIPTPPHPGLCSLSSLRRGDILGIHGPSGSGKTHLLYYLICSCILPLHIGGWNKVAVVFDADATFDINRLQTILRRRLAQQVPLDSTSGRLIPSALRNVHIYRPKSSLQLASGIANLSSHHASNLPTSEIALIAIDSLSAFHWSDRFMAEQLHAAHLAGPASLFPNPAINPFQTVLTALRSFRRSHLPVTVLTNWGLNHISAAGSLHADSYLHGQHLQLFPTLMNSNGPSPQLDDSDHFSLTHRITLNVARLAPLPVGTAIGPDERSTAPTVRHVEIHAHVKSARDDAELLLLRITPEQVVVRVENEDYASDSEEEQ